MSEFTDQQLDAIDSHGWASKTDVVNTLAANLEQARDRIAELEDQLREAEDAFCCERPRIAELEALLRDIAKTWVIGDDWQDRINAALEKP